MKWSRYMPTVKHTTLVLPMRFQDLSGGELSLHHLRLRRLLRLLLLRPRLLLLRPRLLLLRPRLLLL
ncbi:MAG: hypothetical protein CL432_01610, partial [Acidimicrobiaceae bacterium]|nr:hypothetical protein [Acidimicrobiaceae bacterium]